MHIKNIFLIKKKEPACHKTSKKNDFLLQVSHHFFWLENAFKQTIDFKSFLSRHRCFFTLLQNLNMSLVQPVPPSCVSFSTL
jgi:hypothetical protein